MENKLYDVLAKLTEAKKYSIDVEENVVLTKEQLGEMISSDYSVSVEALENGKLLKAFEAADKQVANLIKDYKKQGLKEEVIIFNLQYVLNPDLPFSYKEAIYRSVEKLGEAIWESKEINEEVKEAISLGLVSKYIKYKKLDAAKEDLLKQVKYAEDYFKTNEEVSYYLTGLYLYNKPSYKYGGRHFKDFGVFYNYLMKQRKMIDFAEKFEEDGRFVSWIYYLGKGDVIVAWKKEMQRIEELNYYYNKESKNKVEDSADQKVEIEKVSKKKEAKAEKKAAKEAKKAEKIENANFDK